MDLLRIFKNSTVYPDSLMNGGSTKPSQSQLTIGQSGDRYNTLNTPLYCLSLRPQPTQRQRDAERKRLLWSSVQLYWAWLQWLRLEQRRDNRINYLSAVQWPGYNPPWAWAGMTLTTRIQGGIFLKISRFKTVVISMSWFCQRKQCKKVFKKDWMTMTLMFWCQSLKMALGIWK